jgi:hypothetical protein
MKALLPENEPDRLNALGRYRILDTPPDGAFDHIAEMAAIFFRVPIALASMRLPRCAPTTASVPGRCALSTASRVTWRQARLIVAVSVVPD